MMDEINIRTIQHYLYCPHRWGLLEIDRAWAENAFVVKADLLHERVHDPNRSYTLKNKKVFTSVNVYNDEFGLFGVTDCIEALKSKSGCLIGTEHYNLTIVEYKPTSPKQAEYNEDDAMQVFAQKLCVDATFHTDSNAVLYYADAKRRVPLPFKERFDEYQCKMDVVLLEMRKYLQKGEIPPIRKGQKCSGCSMKDLCMPFRGSREKLRKQMMEMIEEDE